MQSIHPILGHGSLLTITQPAAKIKPRAVGSCNIFAGSDQSFAAKYALDFAAASFTQAVSSSSVSNLRLGAMYS